MKKSLFMIVLVFATVAFAAAQAAPAPGAQQSAPPSSTAGAPPSSTAGAPTGQTPAAGAPGQTAPGQPGAAPGQTGAAGQTGQPAQKKEIKNAAEYNAYMSALNTQDPNAKAQALESFLQTYPQSVVKDDALELLMAAYQQAGNIPKLQDTAQRLLQVNPNHVPALALLAVTNRTACEQALQQNPSAPAPPSCQQALQFAERGLQALPNWNPEGVAPDAVQKQKAQLGPLMNSAAGFCALQLKNYPVAEKYLRAAVENNPNATVADVYPLAVAYLEQKPPDPQGLYFAARAVDLSQGTPAQAQIQRYALAKYTRYHGGQDGWDQLLAEARTSPMPPPNFQVAPAPTPAEQAAKLVATKKVEDMSFDEFELIFTSGNQQAIDQVWNAIKGKPIAFEAKVVQSGAKQLTMAATAEDIEKNPPQADVTLTMAAALGKPPAPGTMAQVSGVPVSYTPNPFMITMDNGKPIGATAKSTAKPTTTRSTTRHSTTRRKPQ
jgi:tetratricopeptide (TPR) repeat protein